MCKRVGFTPDNRTTANCWDYCTSRPLALGRCMRVSTIARTRVCLVICPLVVFSRFLSRVRSIAGAKLTIYLSIHNYIYIYIYTL